MKKINVLLVIRKGQPELDWIAPVLYQMRSTLNIYIFLSTETILPKIEKNPNYLILKQITKKVFWPKKMENLFWKILSKFLRIIKINISSTLSTFIYKKIHNIENLKKNIGLNREFDFVFTEYGNNSSWVKALFEYKKKPIIFNYPSSPLTFFQRKGFEFYKKKLFCDYVFLITKYDFNYWSKAIDKSKMISIGNPSYDPWWLKKIEKKNKVKFIDKRKKILFAYNSDFGLLPKNKEYLLEDDLNSFMKIFTSDDQFKNSKLIFKIHPFRNNPRYLNILKNYDKKFWEIKNDPLILLARNTDAVLSSFDSSALLDGLYSGKPSIEFFRSFNNKTTFPKVSLHQIVGISVSMTKKNIKSLIIKALFKPNNIIWKKQKKIFNKIYSTNKNSSNIANEVILKKY
tara:strand:- start:104 stop:1306 length:1203 start_codon:yes stop_codon:yes gene_type:complete